MEPADDQPTANEAPVKPWKQRQEQRKIDRDRCYDACEAGDFEQLRQILRSAQLEKEDLKQLMIWAIGEGNLDATRCFLEHGADAKSLPVSMLVAEGHFCSSLDMFKLLGSSGLDYKSSADNILIRVANSREILDWLLDQGVDINRGGNLRIYEARRPISKGPPSPARFKCDNTCQILNVVAGQGDVALFDHLVSRGADPARSNALHYVGTCKDAEKSVAMIQHLIETYHMDVNADGRHDGLNELASMDLGDYGPRGGPLENAIMDGNIPAIETLLKYGADPSNCCSTAIQYKQAPVLKVLLETGVNSLDCLGKTIVDNYLEGAELCLNYGADLAAGELYDKHRAEDPRFRYSGMTREMRKLLDDWKAKLKEQAEDTELKVQTSQLEIGEP